MDEEKILNLWRWFHTNELKIRESIEKNLRNEQEAIVQNLDNLVLDLGMFSWDIGPGKNKPWFFTISPNGDKELLAKTKKIMTDAPELDSWEFNYAKPAKKWDRILNVYDTEMELRTIDTSNWNYVTIKSESEEIEVLLEAENIAQLDNETANNTASLFVINEIGEEAKIEHISSVSIAGKLEDKYQSIKSNIDLFKNDII